MVAHRPRTVKLECSNSPHREYEFPISDVSESDASPTGAPELIRITQYYLGNLFENGRQVYTTSQIRKLQQDFIRCTKRNWMKYRMSVINGEQYLTSLNNFTKQYPNHESINPSNDMSASEKYSARRNLVLSNTRHAYITSLNLSNNASPAVHPLADYAFVLFAEKSKRVYGNDITPISKLHEELRQIEQAFDEHRDARKFAIHVRDTFQPSASYTNSIDVRTEFDKSCYLKAGSSFLTQGAYWTAGDVCDVLQFAHKP